MSQIQSSSSQSSSSQPVAHQLDPSDHRVLAQRMGLFHQQPDAAGMVFWHPAGFQMFRALEGFVRQVMQADGYAELRTPQLMRREVWEASGHWAHFRDNMFCLAEEGAELSSALKPVSCPGHLAVFRALAPSYRDLPLRLSEFGVVHRDEAGGALHGLFRLRQFTQDDGHILCEAARAEAEVERFLRGVKPFYSAFGFEHVSVALSTRPADRAGSDAEWDAGEAQLRRVLDRMGWPYVVQEGAGAFYGPKLEFGMLDRQGRSWQCGTIQFDLFMPGRFGAKFVGQDGRKQVPVMLHRALCGSLERFLGVVLEHHAGRVPLWLAPRQVRVLAVSPAQHAAAEALVQELRSAGVRADADLSSESLGRRIAQASALGVGQVAVLGQREVQQARVALREADSQRSLERDAWFADLALRARPPQID